MRYILKNTWTWVFIFGLIFLLSMDFYTWEGKTGLGPLNIPVWVYRFAVYHLLFVAALMVFVRHFWKDKDAS